MSGYPGISGLDLQRQLADANVYIPIIIITGHGDIPMSVRATKAGAVEFLTQPFRDQDLLDAIQLALDRDRARRQRGAEIAVLRERFEYGAHLASWFRLVITSSPMKLCPK